jgi:hypothetical protein
MSNSTTESSKDEAIIDEVEVTSDTLTGRGGLSLFVRYLRGIGLYGQLETFFGSMRKSRKAQAIAEVFKQLFCFFLDGTSRHLVYFDSLRDDEGYARAMETEPGAMLSSHAVKRFFRGFWWPRMYLFCDLLRRPFVCRLFDFRGFGRGGGGGEPSRAKRSQGGPREAAWIPRRPNPLENQVRIWAGGSGHGKERVAERGSYCCVSPKN